MLQPVPLDVRETDSQLLVSAKVPGFKECELALFVDAQRLFLTGTAIESTKARQGAPLYSEWHSNQIFREFFLPVEVEPEIVETQLRRGVLDIVFLKQKSYLEVGSHGE